MKLLNCAVYLAVTGFLGFLLGRILPTWWPKADRGWFRCFAFERGGTIYEKLGIRSWHAKVPDMSKLFPFIMPPKNLLGNYQARLPRMIQETCIAEITHIALSFVGLGCLWIYPGPIGVLVTLIDILLFNLPFILIQRYNRPRLLHLQQKLEARNDSK